MLLPSFGIVDFSTKEFVFLDTMTTAKSKKRDEEENKEEEEEEEEEGEEGERNYLNEEFLQRLTELQQVMPISLKNLGTFSAALGISSKALVGLNLDGYLFHNLAQEVWDAVDLSERTVEEIVFNQAASEDPWPGPMRRFARMLISGMYARYFFRLGHMEKAVHYACQVLAESEKEKLDICTSG